MCPGTYGIRSHERLCFALDEEPTDHETEDEREAREERNRQCAEDNAAWLKKRRRWKYDIHERLDDGRIRFVCPFHAGKLWCDEVAPSPKLRDGAEFAALPEGTTKCCNGTFVASLEDLVKIGHQEPAFFSPEHVEAYAQRIPVEGRFGIDQEMGAHEPRSCRAARLEPHALASLIFDAVGNLQLTMNKEIDEIYDMVDNYRAPADPANNKPADSEPASATPADPANGAQADNTHNNSTIPLTAVRGPLSPPEAPPKPAETRNLALKLAVSG